MIKRQELVEDFMNFNLEVSISSNFISCNALVITNEFLKRVKEKELGDLKLKNILSLLGTDILFTSRWYFEVSKENMYTKRPWVKTNNFIWRSQNVYIQVWPKCIKILRSLIGGLVCLVCCCLSYLSKIQSWTSAT